jgi:LTXXQ motif family protein
MRSIVTGRIWMPAIATIVSVAGGFGAAVAQEQDMPGAMDPGRNGQGAMMCRTDEHIDGQLAYLQTELKITEAQTPQWNVFANTFRADKEKNARLCKSTENEQARSKMMSASLPESLGRCGSNRYARWRPRYSRFIRF